MKMLVNSVLVLLILLVFFPQPVKAQIVDDAWMSTYFLDKLKNISDPGEYDDLEHKARNAIKARLSLGPVKDYGVLIDLVYVMRAARQNRNVLSDDGGAEFFKWLLDNRALSEKMFRAVKEHSQPGDAFGVLSELRKENEKAVLKYPDLAIAVATTTGSRCVYSSRQEDQITPVEKFKYYIEGNFQYDFSILPFEVLQYMTDSKLSLEERQWVKKKYGPKFSKGGNPSKVGKDFKLDKKFIVGAGTKKIDNYDYTLANLKKYGGSFMDQAYYVAEVSKALGFPATVVMAEMKSRNDGWAKVLHFSKRSKTKWNTVRHKLTKEHLGKVYEPVEGESIDDSRFEIIEKIAVMNAEEINKADAAVEAADIISPDIISNTPADIDELKKLAIEFNEKVGRKKPVKINYIKANREINGKMLRELLGDAVSNNSAYVPAWILFEDLCRRAMLSRSDVNSLTSKLISKNAAKNPEFTSDAASRIAKTIDDDKFRQEIYIKTISKITAKDLQARLYIKLGDELRQSDKRKDAYKAYYKAAELVPNHTKIAIPAAEKAEDLLAATPKKCKDMYKKLFAKTKRELVRHKRKKIDSPFYTSSSYYVFGRKLAGYYEELKKDEEADKIRKKIKPKV